MSAAQLTKAMEKASTESSKITQMMIDAGRGYERPSDMMKKSDPLSLKYQKSASFLQDLYAEKSRRITYSGTMRPIKYQENPTMATRKFSPAQIAAQKLFAERARAGTLGKGKRKANPVKGEKTFKTGDYVKTDRGEIGRVSFYKDQPKGYANVYRLIDVKANDPYAQTFLENGNFINGTRLKAYKPRKPNPGLYENINAKRERIAAGSGEKMRKPGQAGRPTAKAFEQSAMTAKRNPVIPSLNYDYIMIDDIKMVAVNDGNLYRQQGRPIVENLARKMAKGTFDAQKAVKLFGYLADSAVRNYSVQQLDYKKPTLTILSKPEREILAQNFLEYYADEIKDASSGYKRNPDKSKPRAYVMRASQATGRPPVKGTKAGNRLITRRKMALKAPAGYFPNPKAAAMMTGYQVICMHPKKHVVGIFKTMAEAKMVATAMANAKGVPYGVKAVKVHKSHFAV